MREEQEKKEELEEARVSLWKCWCEHLTEKKKKAPTFEEFEKQMKVVCEVMDKKLNFIL
jgi:hypothetical protein